MPLDAANKKFLRQLGLKLRQIRLEKNWTLEQTEEHGWPSWRHLQKIEAGKNINITTLRALSKVYRLRLSEILKDLD